MLSGLLGIYMLENSIFGFIRSLILFLSLQIMSISSQILLGYASLGQAFVGMIVGIFLHFYSTRLPQFFIIVDTILFVRNLFFNSRM